MEKVGNNWTCKLPHGHARLLVNVSIRELDTGIDVTANEDTGKKLPEMQLSKEVQDFIDGCVGKVRILNSMFEIVFSDKEDYVRYRMIDFPERFPF